MSNLEQFKRRVFNFSTNLVIEQLSVGIPKKQIQENLAYAVEAQFGMDMMASIQVAENLMTKMPNTMKKMEELAEKMRQGA